MANAAVYHKHNKVTCVTDFTNIVINIFSKEQKQKLTIKIEKNNEYIMFNPMQNHNLL